MSEKTINQETFDKWLDGMMAEIGAGSVLAPRNEGDRAHNAANSRAKEIIRTYKTGSGLFQIGEPFPFDAESGK